MGTKNGHTFLQIATANIKHGYSLLHAGSINLVPSLKAFPVFDDILQIAIAL